jgi:predicted transcriptional regulator
VFRVKETIMTDNSQSHAELLALTADIVASHFANNSVAPAEVAGVIETVYSTLQRLGTPAAPPPPKQEPAVSIRSSIKPDHIVCLEDGKKLKMLKRHLMTHYGMTPDDYRTKWGLPGDYPMVAPNYAEQRRVLAKSIGLGTKKTSKPRGRPRKNPV